MTEDAVSRAIARIDAWIRLYTRRLPRAIAQDRRDEVLADVGIADMDDLGGEQLSSVLEGILG